MPTKAEAVEAAEMNLFSLSIKEEDGAEIGCLKWKRGEISFDVFVRCSGMSQDEENSHLWTCFIQLQGDPIPGQIGHSLCPWVGVPEGGSDSPYKVEQYGQESCV